MRLHKIKLKNFISHVNTEIDFERITNQYGTNFILISGDTGSGKSSILDGLIAGLYGIGGQKSFIGGREPLSSYASDKHWQVEVEFSIGDRRYKVLRKGSTATWFQEQNGKMVRTNEPAPLPIKDGKLARKVMVIPQGDYLKILTATKNERQKLLLQLINVDWLDRFIKLMKERRNLLNEMVKQDAIALKNHLIQTLELISSIKLPEITEVEISTHFESIVSKTTQWSEQLQQIDAEQQIDALIEFIQREKVFETLKQLIDSLAQTRQKIKELVKHRQSAKSQLEKQLTKLEALLSPLQETQQILNNLKTLEANREIIIKLEKQLAELRLLEQLFKEPLLKLDKTTTEIKNLKQDISKINKVIRQLTISEQSLRNLQQVLTQYEHDLYNNLNELISAIKRINEVLNVGKTYYKQWQEAEQHRNTLETLHNKASHLQELADLPAQIKPYLDKIIKIEQELTRLKQEKQAQNEDYKNMANSIERTKFYFDEIILKQIEEFKQKREQVYQQLTKQKEAKRKAEQEREIIEDNYRRIIIAELVSQLKEGEPCPICGSTHHPDPATADEFSQDDLQRVIKERNRLKREIAQLDKQTQELETEQVNIEKTLEQLTKEKDEYQTHLNNLQNKLTKIETELQKLKEQIEAHQKELESHKQQLREIILQSNVHKRYKPTTKNLVEYAQYVLNELHQDWQDLLTTLQDINIVIQNTDFSGSSIGNVINAIKEKLSDIDKARLQYEAWKQESYDKAIKNLETARNNLYDITHRLIKALENMSHREAKNMHELLHNIVSILVLMKDISNRKEPDIFQQSDTLNKAIANLQQNKIKLQEHFANIESTLHNTTQELAEKKGTLNNITMTLKQKEKEQQDILDEIDAHKTKHNIHLSLKEIKERLQEVEQQSTWQEKITRWKTERKSYFKNLMNKIKDMDRLFRSILSDTHVPQMPKESHSTEAFQSTKTDLSHIIAEIEQWLVEIEKALNYEEKTLKHNLEQQEREIISLQETEEEITSITERFKHQHSGIQEFVQKLGNSINELMRFQRLVELTGIEEKKGKHALPGLKTWIYQFIMKNMLKNASPYLQEFTDGRLDFVITDDEKIDTIRLIDHTYGKVRNVNDLSGGEKFMVALSLALGLTDLLMQFEKNAVRPNFMFIDEGFGTLDTERLRKVVTQLKNYAEKHDIMLGVISHRQEMHEMAPVRLHVTHDRTRKGSKIQIIAN